MAIPGLAGGFFLIYQGQPGVASLGPPARLSHRLFRLGGSPPTTIDYSKKLVPAYSNLSNLEDLASEYSSTRGFVFLEAPIGPAQYST